MLALRAYLICACGSLKTSETDLYKSVFFMLKKSTPMRKIIITLIATFFMIAPFENAKGQMESRITSADFPTVNVLTGVNARLSFGLWRFEIFGQIGQYFQMFEERMTRENYWSERRELHSPRFQSMQIINVGMKFRVTERDRIILGSSGNYLSGAWVDIDNWWQDFYLGYIRKENLSQRTSIEFCMLFTPPFLQWNWGQFRYGAVAVGTRLNFEIFNNLKLTTQLMYTRKFNVRNYSFENISRERLLTRNIINFSVGMHYHIPLFGGQQQQAQQRPPCQRVAPHQRALPCPPGQMRHNRSWDRPSSVFNHPTGR